MTTQPNLQPNLTQLQPWLGLHGNWIQPPPPHTQTFNQIPGNLEGGGIGNPNFGLAYF